MPGNFARPKTVLSRGGPVVHRLHICRDGSKTSSIHGWQRDRLNIQDIQSFGHPKWIKLARSPKVARFQAHLPKMEGYPSDRAYIKFRRGRHGSTRGYGRFGPQQENFGPHGPPTSLLRFSRQEQATLHILTSCCWLSNDCDIYKRCTFKANTSQRTKMKNDDWYHSKYI